jgi:hypothetical protein
MYEDIASVWFTYCPSLFRSQFEAIQEQAEAERAAKLQAIAEAQALSHQLSEAKALIASGGIMEHKVGHLFM